MKEQGEAFCERVLTEMRDDLYQAYIAYDEAKTRALEYPEYEKFMSALRICGFTIHDRKLQKLTTMSQEQHDALRPAPPSQPVAAPASFPPPETRLAELLARLRDLLDEFTRKPRRLPAAPAEEARAGDAEDYYSDGP